MRWLIVLLFVWQPADLLAQQYRSGPRQQRFARERTVAVLGPESRDFIETYGEDAVAALWRCKRPVSLALVQFFNSGALDDLPRARDLLRVIAMPNHGSEVASWAIAHGTELMDEDRFDAFLLDPLPYALDLKDLDDGAMKIAQARSQPPREASMSNSQILAIVGGVVLLLVAVVWHFRKRRAEKMI